MYFTKYPHPSNFEFASSYDAEGGAVTIGNGDFKLRRETFAGEVFQLSLSNRQLWPTNDCLESLNIPSSATSDLLELSENGDIVFRSSEGKILLQSPPSAGVGVCGQAWMFQFEVDTDARFYGMGAKHFDRVELSGLRTKFWNTDVWGDFHSAQWGENTTDPPYYACPYLVVETKGEFIGLLVHNPEAVFLSTPGMDESRVFVEWQRTSPNLILGSEGGQPDLWILRGPTLLELTQKFHKLVGQTPRPPIWSLGYHQSRWGYGGHDDLLELDHRFQENQIPCDGLWLDLDYMDEFRIFQTNKEMFPDGPVETMKTLALNGRHIVSIIDPGVKSEAGYAVYDDGNQKGVFCKNVQGRNFIGMVWPGETVFPDFSMPKARDWWTGYSKRFIEEGFSAAWLDMNDPSTGPVDPQAMLFRDGTRAHAAFHNQYALGMQMATFKGFLEARPNERPFILSRSGFIGTSKYAAIWSGDNLSNYYYLAQSIPTAIGMALSGQPFNGCDVGGFGGHVTESLIQDWMKCAFLFPFMRNHTGKDSRHQEPYAFAPRVVEVLRRYIRLRYKLMPYFYNLFIEQESSGDPVMRPLFYHYSDEGLAALNEEFLVGRFILQAPFTEEDAKTRSVVLPGSEPWYDCNTGDWNEPGTVVVKKDRIQTPMYMAAGALVPMQRGTPIDNKKELFEIDIHVFVPPNWTGETKAESRADDGISYNYRQGVESAIQLELVSADGHIAIATRSLSDAAGKINPRFIFHGSPKSVRLDGRQPVLNRSKVTLTGKSLAVQVAN